MPLNMTSITIKCDNGTIKYEKKIREPPNMTKLQRYVGIIQCNNGTVKNVRKKKSKNTTECDKSNVSTT